MEVYWVSLPSQHIFPYENKKDILLLHAVKEMLDASDTSITFLMSFLLGAYKNKLVGVA